MYIYIYIYIVIHIIYTYEVFPAMPHQGVKSFLGLVYYMQNIALAGKAVLSTEPELVIHLTKSLHSFSSFSAALGSHFSRIKKSSEATFRPTKWPCMSCCCGSCRPVLAACRFEDCFTTHLENRISISGD